MANPNNSGSVPSKRDDTSVGAKSPGMALLPKTIRGKLGLAFGVIAAAAIIGGAVGQWSYEVIRQKIVAISEVSVPSVIATQRIGEVTARIAAVAPALNSADSDSALSAQRNALTVHIRELRAAVENLARHTKETESIRRMNSLADEVAATLAVQTRSVAERLALAKQSRANVEATAAEHLRFNSSIRLIIEIAMEEFRTSSASVIKNTDQSIKRLNELTMKGLLPILLLRLQANYMVQAIESARTATPEQIETLWQAFVSANSVASRQLKTLQRNKDLAKFLDIEPVKHVFKQVVRLGVGDGNVFDRRLKSLAAVDENSSGSPQQSATEDEAKSLARLEADLDRTLNRLITLIRGRTATEGFDIKQYVSETLNSMATRGLAGISDLQKLEALGNHIAGVLTAAALLESEHELDTFKVNFARAAQEFDAILDKYENDPKMSPVIESARHLVGLGDGDPNLFAIHIQELQAIARGRKFLLESIRLMEELSATATQIVQATQTDSTEAAHAVARSLTTSRWTLAVAATTGVLVLLVVWLYVRHSLGARLTALSNSMLAIADGNLKARTPRSGDDEIGRMAEALGIFRDTAIEVEEKNLREIEETRRRLVDAIENTSEGFAFYDNEDRLELCNTRYEEMLYPGLGHRLVPGTKFEDIIRSAAESGLIPDAEGRIEEWVAERLKRHLNPGEQHLHQLRDNLWILISERKTNTGGTVAVYADVTELKQREEELAEKSQALEQKSNALEQLSNQLAKYLSPQVYDSIFRGKQEVKVESNRKKLTVFFSDIADFTETADRLESEELTQLLNHYLTEMSQIALDFGATIDKYVGDAILIFFGDPETRGVKKDALAGVEMAIAMRKKMNELQDVWRASGIEKPLRCRMGIHTDYCTVGNFGSEDRLDYTIIGGGVNLAARLESAAAPGELLISYKTYAHVKDRIHCEKRDTINVKGIAYPVATYQVIDAYENLEEELNLIREDHPSLRLNIDMDALSANEISQIATILGRTLDRVESFGQGVKRKRRKSTKARSAKRSATKSS